MCRLTKRLFTQATFVWFLSTVNSVVPLRVSSRCKSFSTDGTLTVSLLYEFYWAMLTHLCHENTSNSLHLCLVLWTFISRAKYAFFEKKFLTIGTCIRLVNNTSVTDFTETTSICKLFVTQCTNRRSWLCALQVFIDINFWSYCGATLPVSLKNLASYLQQFA